MYNINGILNFTSYNVAATMNNIYIYIYYIFVIEFKNAIHIIKTTCFDWYCK